MLFKSASMHRSQTNKKKSQLIQNVSFFGILYLQMKEMKNNLFNIFLNNFWSCRVAVFWFLWGWMEGGRVRMASNHHRERTHTRWFVQGWLHVVWLSSWPRELWECVFACVCVFVCVRKRKVDLLLSLPPPWSPKRPVGLHQFECVRFIQHSPSFFFLISYHLPARSFSSPLQGLSYFSL